MSVYTSQRVPNIRSDTHKPKTRYECRVVRSVAPNQPELGAPLAQLKEHSSNIVNYKEVGKLGVTLVMLEPVLRQILTTNRRGDISRDALSGFEQELNDALHHSRYADYNIPLQDTLSPLGLYGKHKQYLGLRLAERDYRLVGDRAVVEHYIRDNYDVGKRFMARNLTRMLPHVTIGDVRYENIEPEQRESMQADPTAFVLRQAYDSMEHVEKRFGMPEQRGDIIFPETITLNGLQIFCQSRS